MIRILLALHLIRAVQGSVRKIQQARDCSYDYVDQDYCSHVPFYKGQNNLMVVNSNFTDSSDYPFLVSLQEENEDDAECFTHFCAGTMLAPNLVLSAAHCFYEKVNLLASKKNPRKPIYVSFYPQCRHQGNSKHKRIGVLEVFLHPSYKSNTKYADIAILKLQGFYKSDDGFIQLDLQNPVSSFEKVEAVGYGYVQPTDRNGYNVYPLRQGVFAVSSPPVCKEQLKLHNIEDGIYNEEGMICAYAPGVDTCDGDSGGPVMRTGKDGQRTQVAVVSWGTGVQCRSFQSTATVFAKLSAFADWIKEIVQELSLDDGFPLTVPLADQESPSTIVDEPSPPPRDIQEEISEEAALMAFKEGLGNPPSLSKWQKGEDFCSWQEVICNDDGKVTTLDAVFYGFTGTMAVELSALRSLEKIYIPYSDIQGKLPPEYSTWTDLKEAMLFNCEFTGTLPPTYSTWKSVTLFTISDNSLSGVLPEEYSTWELVETVSVKANRLSGSIPQRYTSWGNIQEFNADEQSGSLCIDRQLQSFFSGVGKKDLRGLPTC